MSIVLSDPPSERVVLAGIIQYGAKAYFDVVDILQETSFTIDSNAIIYRCLKHIFEKDDSPRIDNSLIQSAAHEVGLSHILSKPDEIKHLQAISTFPVILENVRKFAAKIRKLEVGRLMCRQLDVAKQKTLEIRGDETVSHILSIAEDTVFDFTSLLNDDDAPVSLGEDIEEHIQFLEDNPVEQIGISTGFPAWDQAVGGGLRKATVNVIGARAKQGKSCIALNIGQHITDNLQIPIFFLDTELTKEENQNRMLASKSGVPIQQVETGQYVKKPDWKQKIRDAGKTINHSLYNWKSISGLAFEDQLSAMRRWLTRTVGLNDDGTAKDCVIFYDYLKLMDMEDISEGLREYQVLGFRMTALHNFAVRYKVPIVVFLQLNRDGINKEDTSTASGSDRIIWLCSNFTILKEKTDEEISEDGEENGNKKLLPIIARHGPGIDRNDYINCHAKLWCMNITEGKTRLELKQDNNNSGQDKGFIVDDKDGKISFN